MAPLWNDETELLALVRRELFTAVLGDIMDQMGLLRQFLPPRIRPIASQGVLAGRALPVLAADCPGQASHAFGNAVLAKPFGLMLEALDDLRPNEIYLCTGSSPRYALWGELMSTRARGLGAAGAVLDGYVRDTRAIREMGFSCFGMGSYAQDQAPRGRVLDFRIAVELEGVRISPGQLLVGDADGVCTIPPEAEHDVVVRAIEKVRSENQVREAIAAGMSAVEAFRRFRIM